MLQQTHGLGMQNIPQALAAPGLGKIEKIDVAETALLIFADRHFELPDHLAMQDDMHLTIGLCSDAFCQPLKIPFTLGSAFRIEARRPITAEARHE